MHLIPSDSLGLDRLLDAWRDLALGSVCVVCSRPGRVLCRPCASDLPGRGEVAWPSPSPVGLARPTAAGAYDGALKAMVNAHKEHRAFALATPLGRVLAVAVRAHLDVSPSSPPRLVLVPVPSRRSVVRARGHDPLLRVARAAAGVLRGQGEQARVMRALTPVGAARDQSSLSAPERASNLRGSLRSHLPAHTAGLCSTPGSRRALVLVVDDVLTTGSTAREAQRALEAVAWRVDGIATIAATQRRREVG